MTLLQPTIASSTNGSSKKNILLVTEFSDLGPAMGVFEDVSIATGPDLAFAQWMVSNQNHTLRAVYAEDRLGTSEQLHGLVLACQAASVPLFVGLFRVGRPDELMLQDLGANTGIHIAAPELRTSEQLTQWIGQGLSLQEHKNANKQVTIAISSSKGGVGKTTTIATLAQALSRLGIRILLVDGDLSNSGIVPAFKIPPGFPSYLQARADGGPNWARPEHLRQYIYKHAPTNVSFLLGSDEVSKTSADLPLPEWSDMMRALRRMSEFDLVLVDTSPEIKRRPYALLVAREGGYVIVPIPPSNKDRMGAANALTWFADDDGIDLSSHCMMLFMQPEKGVTVTTQDIIPGFVQQFSNAQVLGTLPRAPRQISLADEAGGDSNQFVSVLDVVPLWKSFFSQEVYSIADRLCQLTGLEPRLARPSVNIVARWYARSTHRR